MNKIKLNIDGKEIFAVAGQTILEVCKENDIHIPTLCYDERTKIYGSCGLCMVEIEGFPKLLKACATEVGPGMPGTIIKTNTTRVIESRKTNLELLISNHKGDCVAPCKKACPAQTDCQGYVGLVANGEFEEALNLIKEKIPLPSCIGRVCPHPCEDECRRGLLEGPVGIANIKRAAGDFGLDYEAVIEDIEDDTDKSVAVIGGGPFGLSLAYFLRRKGHAVTIFEAMPKAGGMLRYGIPEYRLPADVIDAEIDVIEDMGVEIVTDCKLGKDVHLDDLKKEYDAVAIGIGAWVSTGTGAKGEDAGNIYGGIDFLRKIVRNEEFNFGDNVAIIGGGNTAMDCARSSVRLGAANVYNVYRRTIDEMPADDIEIEEGEEEGVIFKNLRNPIEYVKDKDGNVKEIILQVMELGEPDESGRRKPVPVKGKTETLKVDTVLLAIGQAVDAKLVKGVTKTKKGGISYDPKTFMTNIDGVFAGGDCGNDKISIAVEAIADATKCAETMDAYLKGEEMSFKVNDYVKRDDITKETFEDREKMLKEKLPTLSPAERKGNFIEVTDTYDFDTAVKDAQRCLSCGCGDYKECKLIDLANEYGSSFDKFEGDKTITEFEDDHPFIIRDPNKCILCGLCVRVCDEVMGVGALGLVNRGFDTVALPTLEKPLKESGCVSCGTCVSTCPVGALQERLSIENGEVPLETEKTKTTCPHCSVGCELVVETKGDMIIKSNPSKEGKVNKGLSCGRGKFGFNSFEFDEIVDNKLESDYDAYVSIVKKIQSLNSKYGKGSVAFAISPKLTNEAIFAIKKLAENFHAKTFSFSNRCDCDGHFSDIFGQNASPNTIDELIGTDLIITTGFQTFANPIIRLKIKEAVEKGAKLININNKGSEGLEFGETVETSNSVKLLLEIMKEVSSGTKAKISKDIKDILSKTKSSADAKRIADEIKASKKVMFVVQDAVLSVSATNAVFNIALLSGHIGSPRDGVLVVREQNNSQGLLDRGITDCYDCLDENVKGLVIFGEDVSKDVRKKHEFIAVLDSLETEIAKLADITIPMAPSAYEVGTFTNTERRFLKNIPYAVDGMEFVSPLEIVAELFRVVEKETDYDDFNKVVADMLKEDKIYNKATLGEITGGVLKAVKLETIKVKQDDKLLDVRGTTDKATKVIDQLLPVAKRQANLL